MVNRFQCSYKEFVFVWISTCLFLSLTNCEDNLSSQWNNHTLDGEILISYLDEANSRLYIGSANKIYEFDLGNVSVPLGEIYWPSPSDLEQACIMVNSDSKLCQNNIRIIQSANDTHLYVCGTLTYNPSCAYIKKQNFQFIETSKESGRWKLSYNPYVPIESIMSHGKLFSATRESQGDNGLITKSLNGAVLRTPDTDKFVLNDPEFVGIHEVRSSGKNIGDKIMVLFREKAEEFQPYKYGLSADPKERNIASRIATVCANDHGGTNGVLDGNFATFSKMSIVCDTESKTDKAPFQYTHLESTFVVENERDRPGQTLYGVFTMPSDAVAGTAVCAFRMQDVKEAMKTDQYWTRQDGQRVSRTYDDHYGSAPGMCVDDTRDLSRARLSFSKTHPIKFGNVYPSGRKPLYQESGVRYRHIVADYLEPRESSLGTNTTVLFMVTDDGLLKRLVLAYDRSSEPWLLPDIRLIEEGSEGKVRSIRIGKKDLYIFTDATVIQAPKASCSLYRNCRQCDEAGDPYCSWTYAGCSSVFDDTSLQKRSADTAIVTVSCNLNEEPEFDPREELIAELMINQTELSRQYDEVESQLSELQAQHQSYREAYQGCLATKMELSTDLSTCNESKTSLTTELQSRPTNEQFNQEISKAQDALENAASCYRELSEISVEKKTLNNELSNIQAQLIESEKDNKDQMDDLTRKVDECKYRQMKLEDSSKQQQKKANTTIANCIWKTEMGYARISKLIEANKELQDLNNNFTSAIVDLRAQHLDDIQNIKRLTWLHKRNGERGQQNCNHNGWFLSNATGNLFFLGKRRRNYSDASRICHKLGGQLAIFRNVDELRYINNVIRAFQPTRNFWIGLVKDSDNSLVWEDGTQLGNDYERFPRSQQKRLRRKHKYCVEVNTLQKWILVPCERIRRPICQKPTSNLNRLNDEKRKTMRLFSVMADTG
ncbi:unnamed protein product [Clavelina lepadiformis]|uniref:C-type lectin domain-containing protein n=1 Tax=Clavelina lepadiformis TaxID=159417 RepID=A0ABP0GYN6_CLALP